MREELEEYSPQDIESNPTPTPAFDDLRGIQFTTGTPLQSAEDPQPTTYRAPIDFDLGTTAATGIEVDDVVLLKTKDYEDYDDSLANGVDTAYSDEYETEDETDYQPGSENIPIVLEGGASQQAEALPSYDPVVLLVGTPEKVRSLRHVVCCMLYVVLYRLQLVSLSTAETTAKVNCSTSVFHSKNYTRTGSS